MRTRSLVWDRGVLRCERGRIFARGVILVAACISALVVCPASQAQEGTKLTDAAQKQAQPKDTKKLPPAKKKSTAGKAAAKPDGHDHAKAPRFSLPVTKKQSAQKGGTSTAAAGDSAKNSKTSAKTDWQSSCGKGKNAKGTGTKVAGTTLGTSPRTRSTGPKLLVEQIEVSKKPVWFGEMIECEWVFKNEGDVTLSITARGG